MIFVGAREGVKTRMCIGADSRNLVHGDICRQYPVQAEGEGAECGKRRAGEVGQVAVGNHQSCVNAGVGSAGTGHREVVAAE